MRNLKRNMLLVGTGIAGFFVIGAALIRPTDDGDYHLRIYKEGDIYKVDGKPGGNDYRLTFSGGRINWTFTNDTGNDTLRVWIENFTCDGNQTIPPACPLTFDNAGSGCNSAEVGIKQGLADTIGASDGGGTCSQEWAPDWWEYNIRVRTVTPETIGAADPQLIIIRDRLTRFLDSIKFMLRSVKRVLHL